MSDDLATTPLPTADMRAAWEANWILENITRNPMFLRRHHSRGDAYTDESLASRAWDRLHYDAYWARRRAGLPEVYVPIVFPVMAAAVPALEPVVVSADAALAPVADEPDRPAPIRRVVDASADAPMAPSAEEQQQSP